jgi:hypothetical protein
MNNRLVLLFIVLLVVQCISGFPRNSRVRVNVNVNVNTQDNNNNHHNKNHNNGVDSNILARDGEFDLDAATTAGSKLCPHQLGKGYITVSDTDLSTIGKSQVDQITGMFNNWSRDPSKHNPTIGKSTLLKRDVDMPYSRANNGYDRIYALRGQHPKCHGCLKGTFTVNNNINEGYKYGIFNDPGAVYPIWSRFSSGSSWMQHDKLGDSRGFAMKLIGVTGSRPFISANQALEQNTQDFLFATADYFFVDSAKEYAALLPMNTKALLGDGLARIKYLIEGGIIGPVAISRRKKATDKIGGSMVNPTKFNYFSKVPYQLGANTNNAVKYKVSPCTDIPLNSYDNTNRAADKPNYLRMNLHKSIGEDSVCFDFSIMKQGDACINDLEKHTVAWSGSWIKVGKIFFPRQEYLYTNQIEFCENLFFHPWHTIDDHKPLSSIGEARKFAYGNSQDTRRRINRFMHKQITGNEVFSGNIVPPS